MTDKNYDSDFCGSLPIHLINHIQPYGALLVIDKTTLSVVQVSENIVHVFAKTPQQLVNTSLADLISPGLLQSIQKRISLDALDKIPALWTIGENIFVVIEHIHGNLMIVEIDLHQQTAPEQRSFVNAYKEMKITMQLIEASGSIQEVADNCVRELKRISGFDKVMAYRFDSNWNGTVIAEVMEPGMESYLGITFPASDIPQQARQLYLKNPYRLIPDRNYTPVKLYPVINPVTNSFVDLSDCNLRSVAAVHLEYLKNMGVTASMSTRLLSGDALWGLIACHHRTVKQLDFEMRAIFEMLSNIISSRIASLQNSDKHMSSIKAKEKYKSIVEHVYRERDLAKAFLTMDPNLLSLFNAQGAIVSQNHKIFSQGIVPGREHVDELMLWLHAKQLSQIYYTENLSIDYEQASEFKELASGLLVIPINPDSDEYAVLLRQEVIRVVNWGGNPEERITFEAGTRNYHPRNSFQKWQQLVKGNSLPWREEELAAAENLRSFIYEFTN